MISFQPQGSGYLLDAVIAANSTQICVVPKHDMFKSLSLIADPGSGGSMDIYWTVSTPEKIAANDATVKWVFLATITGIYSDSKDTPVRGLKFVNGSQSASVQVEL